MYIDTYTLVCVPVQANQANFLARWLIHEKRRKNDNSYGTCGPYT
jgi:hypothetical protein